jgi:hypothetical protein
MHPRALVIEWVGEEDETHGGEGGDKEQISEKM